jgi:hypothetical protein
MTDAGDKLLEGAKEALAVARGETPAHRLHIDGHAYAPVEQLDAVVVEHQKFTTNARYLVEKARALVDMLDDAERNHGGLYAAKTMRAANELRLELTKWGEK